MFDFSVLSFYETLLLKVHSPHAVSRLEFEIQIGQKAETLKLGNNAQKMRWYYRSSGTYFIIQKLNPDAKSYF